MDEDMKEDSREERPNFDNKKLMAITPSSHSLPLLMNDLCALEPGMDVMPRTSAHGPYHTHLNNNLVHHHNFHHHTDQTKSLQELQNEVGALLEFRDLVIETFPDLKHKMASSGASSTITGLQSSSIVSRREWEPGIRVRRKLNNNFSSSSKDGSNNSGNGGGELIQSSSLLTRSRSNSHSGKKEPKSGEGNGSVIQDSGFSTETSSSKEAHSASSTAGSAGVQVNNISSALTARLTSDPTSSSSDNELWNLLDVIHRRTSRIADDSDQKFANGKSAASTSSTSSSTASSAFQSQMNFMRKEDVQLLRKERDHLMDKMGDFEAEILSNRIKESKLQDQIKELQQTKAELEEQLKFALSQKHELISSRPNIHNNVNNSNDMKSSSNRAFQPIPLARSTTDDSATLSKDDDVTFATTTATAAVLMPQKALKDELNHLGRLDGLISNPNSKLNKVRVPDSKKIAAILLESNIIELQRHLLTITIQNQVLQQRLEQATKSKIFLIKKLDKSKDEVEDLKFQIEERNIELEGARAQIRVMESKLASRFDGGSPDHHHQQSSSTTTTRLSRDGITVMHTSTPNTRLMPQTISTPSMKAMIPLAMDETFQHSSSTESAHDQQERELTKFPETPKRARPSKIPLPGAAMSKSSITTSKPPIGPSSNKSLTKSTSSLYNGASNKICGGPSSITARGSSTRDTSLNRPDSLRNTSIDNNKVPRSSSIPISSKAVNSNSSTTSPSAYTTVVNIPSSSPLNSKYVTSSPLPRPKRDSLTTRVKNLDSLSRLQSTSSSSATTTLSSSSASRSPNNNNMNNTNNHNNNNQNSQNSNGSNNNNNNNRKYTALPVRRMSNISVRDEHHHNNSNHDESVNGGKMITMMMKKSWTTPNIKSTVDNEIIQFKSRELIHEYLHKTRIPEILKTPQQHSSLTFTASAMDEINLAYKHPLVIEEELQYDAGEALAIDSLPHQQQPNSIIVPTSLRNHRKSGTAGDVGDRPHLIGKVTQAIARTWEQLTSAMNDQSSDAAVGDDEEEEEDVEVEDKQSYVLFIRKPFNFNNDDVEENFKVNRIQHQVESSEKFYDSIDEGDDDDDEDYGEDYERETMADGVPDSLEMRDENDVTVWSIES